MALPEQRSRGSVHPYVGAVRSGNREWAPPWATPRDREDFAQDPYNKDHPMDSFSTRVHHGGEVVADHPGPV